MSHIFVSYSRNDMKAVDTMVARLEQDGFDVWIDRKDIRGGELWREEIVKAIHQSFAFLLIVSPESVISKNVGREVALAENTVSKFVPVFLAPVELPDALKYTLSAIQWIEYYRDPETKYFELVEALRAHQPKLVPSPERPTCETELVIRGLKLSKFEKEKREQLLDLIAVLTGTPREDLRLERLESGSVHVFITMPEETAYLLKTAALNRDPRLTDFGIHALRLSGDRDFVLLETGHIGPLPRGKLGGPWSTGGIALITTFLVSAILFSIVFARAQFSPITPPAVTNTFVPPTSPTETFTLTPTKLPTTTPVTPTISLVPAIYGPDPEDFPPGINTLTGLPACDPSLLKFPAVLVSITHFPASARPQAGLSFSPIVFEIYISEGTTRFLAVFYGECPHATVANSSGSLVDQIGPVRSPRRPYVHVLDSYQNSCLVYASASPDLFPFVRGCLSIYGADADDINSALITVTKMNELAQANVQPHRPFNYTGNMFSDIVPPSGQSANLIKVFYNDRNQTRWDFDPSSGKYLRAENNPSSPTQFIPATDRLTGKRLAFSNIIVMFAVHTALKPTVIDIDMGVGSVGDAYLFRDGKAIKIRWTTISEEYEKSTGLRRPIRFTDEAGNPIALKPGHTWVHVMSTASFVNEKGSDEWLARFYAPPGSN
jgi:hypothetical protein